MTDITLRRVADLAALEAPWRALEQRSPTRFFRGWTWTGCLAAERFTDPLLLEAREDGRIVALALFNRRRGRLHLGESGDPAADSVFIEHNGPLIAAGHEALLRPCLQATVAAGRHGLVLSGVDDAVRDAACAITGASCHVRRSRPAPFVDLAALGGGDFPGSLGSSSRYQLRRSARRYGELGALAVRRAADADEGLAWLDALAALHQAAWTARGHPGAFAAPGFMRFHRALVARGLPRGEVDLLRIDAGGQAIGYLYNFMAGYGAARRWVGNYQGGFDYVAATPHQKPGLTCHHLAIEFYRREGRHDYDFMAGEDRYKTNLAHAQTRLHWLEIWPTWSLGGLNASGKRLLHRIVSRSRGKISL